MTHDEYDQPSIPLAAEFEQYDTMLRAIDQANNIRAELAGQIPGMLRAYALNAQKHAATAMAELIVAHPTDSARILMLQKQCAAYAHVMGWVRDRIDAGDAAELDQHDIAEAQKEN